MSEINSINGAGGAQPLRPHSQTSPSPKAAESAGATGDDTVEISAEAQIRSRLAGVPETRTDLIAQVRQQIADGVYETPEKLDLALDRMLDDM